MLGPADGPLARADDGLLVPPVEIEAATEVDGAGVPIAEDAPDWADESCAPLKRRSFRYLAQRSSGRDGDNKSDTHWADFSSRVDCRLGKGGCPSSARSRSTSALATA